MSVEWRSLKISRSVKYRVISEKFKLVLIFSLMVLGCNLTFAQPGSLDTSFDPGMGPNNGVQATVIQNDGKIIIGGNFTSYDGTAVTPIIRLNTDGSLDTSFNPGTGPNNYVRTISIQDDGKIIIGGPFTSYNGTARNRIARLNEDGSLDTSFDPGTGVSGYNVLTTYIQSDGKIIIGGNFTFYNGIERNRIARLNADGSLDTSFDPGSGANEGVWNISLQSNGKIVISGLFTSYSEIARNYIARLNADGSLDTSFDPGSGANDWIFTNSVQSDGKIIIGGYFTSYNGIERNRIARLNAEGSLDASFDPGTGASGLVETTSIQMDGKIIVGGEFTDYNGTLRNSIARLNVDGNLDNSFDTGMGVSGYTVWTTNIQSDGKIIIGGNFITYNGTAINRIARLNTTPTGIYEMGKEHGNVKIFPNPFSSTTTIQTEFELKNAALTIINLSGQEVRHIPNISGHTIILNRNELPGGLYFLRLTQDNEVIGTEKLVITD